MNIDLLLTSLAIAGACVLLLRHFGLFARPLAKPQYAVIGKSLKQGLGRVKLRNRA